MHASLRPLLLAALLLLPACMPATTAAERRQAPSTRPVAVPASPPAMSGEWFVEDKDGGFSEIWTIELVGDALTGTIVYDPTAIPKGYANAPRDLFGRLRDAGNGEWLAMLETPDGTLRVGNIPDQFSFCNKLGTTCRTGRKRLSE